MHRREFITYVGATAALPQVAFGSAPTVKKGGAFASDSFLTDGLWAEATSNLDSYRRTAQKIGSKLDIKDSMVDQFLASASTIASKNYHMTKPFLPDSTIAGMMLFKNASEYSGLVMSRDTIFTLTDLQVRCCIWLTNKAVGGQKKPKKSTIEQAYQLAVPIEKARDDHSLAPTGSVDGISYRSMLGRVFISNSPLSEPFSGQQGHLVALTLNANPTKLMSYQVQLLS